MLDLINQNTVNETYNYYDIEFMLTLRNWYVDICKMTKHTNG